MSESHVQNAVVLHYMFLAVVSPTFAGLNVCPAQTLVLMVISRVQPQNFAELIGFK